MNPVNAHQDTNNTNREPVVVVRETVDTLNSLDRETANHLNALAFVLIRVARADGRICGDERLSMEAILIENARISPEHAVLVTEIACHRAQLTDCGSAYAISRELRNRLDPEQRASILGLLTAVADADGCFCTFERSEIVQIAGELWISPGETTLPPLQS